MITLNMIENVKGWVKILSQYLRWLQLDFPFLSSSKTRRVVSGFLVEAIALGVGALP